MMHFIHKHTNLNPCALFVQNVQINGLYKLT